MQEPPEVFEHLHLFMSSASSYPVRPNVSSEYLALIATSRLLDLPWVFLSQCDVFLCLISRPGGMYMPYKSHQGSGSFPSWTIVTLYLKWRYMKFSFSICTLCVTATNPGTGHCTSCNTLGRSRRQDVAIKARYSDATLGLTG